MLRTCVLCLCLLFFTTLRRPLLLLCCTIDCTLLVPLVSLRCRRQHFALFVFVVVIVVASGAAFVVVVVVASGAAFVRELLASLWALSLYSRLCYAVVAIAFVVFNKFGQRSAIVVRLTFCAQERLKQSFITVVVVARPRLCLRPRSGR